MAEEAAQRADVRTDSEYREETAVLCRGERDGEREERGTGRGRREGWGGAGTGWGGERGGAGAGRGGVRRGREADSQVVGLLNRPKVGGHDK